MKVTGKTKCVNCDKDTPVSWNIDNFDPKVNSPEITDVKVTGSDKTPETTAETKTIEKTIIKKELPTWIPGFKCKDCKDRHKNKKFKRPKSKCSNCDQFSKENPGEPCPQCTKEESLEEITDEDLDEIDFPKSVEITQEEGGDHNHE